MGTVTLIVGELLILESKGSSLVVDLDSWVCDREGALVGFVIDVLGKVEHPFYAIRLEDISSLQKYQSEQLYYMEGASKVLRDEDIQSLKSKSALEAEEDGESSDSDTDRRMVGEFEEE